MINYDGHVQLVDFGLAKKLETSINEIYNTEDENNFEKSYSFCGTYDYMAPEVFFECGYDYRIDFFSLGVFLYEILIGFPPFKRSKNMNRPNDRIHGVLTIPNFINKNVKELLRYLLHENPEKRPKRVSD